MIEDDICPHCSACRKKTMKISLAITGLLILSASLETPAQAGGVPYVDTITAANTEEVSLFILPDAANARGADIGTGWAGSLTMGAGQFCTSPGIVVILKDQAEVFTAAAAKALGLIGTQTMLTDGIASAFRKGQSRIAASEGVQSVLTSTCDGRDAAPHLYQTTAAQWLANEDLGEEVFGPLGLVVLADDLEQMRSVAHALQGQLTCTLHMDASDGEAAKSLMPILERKAGRILANGFPTGVEVSEAMVHGGPYPASTNFGATSVGTMSIRRFTRPVCYQDIPLGFLPDCFDT